MAWLLASLHAVWFVLAIANMSPPAPGLGQYPDRGGWSSATLLAGRPFHFHYESVALKVLITVDLPAMIAVVPVALLTVPFSNLFRLLGSWTNSYLVAGILLACATCQWILAGWTFEGWLARQAPGFHRQVQRWSGPAILILAPAALIFALLINHWSREAGFRHGGISFR